MPTYRSLTDDEDEVFREYTRYAFRPASKAEGEEFPEGPRQVGDRRGLFPAGGDRPLTVCAHHWFEADVRGNRLGTPGLSAVATPPEHRRQGHVRTLLRSALEEYRRRGDHVSILWPFKYAFYRGFGWETAYRYVTYEVPPGRVRSVADRDRGRFVRVTDDEFAELDAVYRSYTRKYDLAITRSEDWWRHRIFEAWSGPRYVYAWEDDTGTIRGYVAFEVDREGGDRELSVADFAATDAVAYRQLWRFIANHDSQVDIVRLREPIDAPLLDHLVDLEAVSVELRSGAMVRLVDVRRTLADLVYPERVDATLVLEVEDDLIDWHDEPFELSVSDGTGACEPSDADPEVTTDIATLSAIAIGARPVRTLSEAERIDAATEPLETLASIFPPRSIYCLDFF